MHPLTIYIFGACLSSVWLMEWKALDEFVNLPDPHYEYTFLQKEKREYHFFGSIIHTINMTSQKWLDESEIDQPVWFHRLTIIAPRRVNIKDSCLLVITPGQNDASSSSIRLLEMELMFLATASKSIVAVLRPVPVEPLTFYKHPLGHDNITEYDILAYSWWRFMNDSATPPHWLVQFPMVKATVRAMDTITDYLMKTYNGSITQFTLIGRSMNAWTAWLTAAVDRRVAAIIPIGMDYLNFTESFRHQFRAYCGWSYMLKPLYEMNITQELDNPRFSDLASHVDPLAYKERYRNVSKFIIIEPGDEVSMPDNTHYYFSSLEGEKILRVIQNPNYRPDNLWILLDAILLFHTKITNNERRLLVTWQITMTNTSAIIYLKTPLEPNLVYSYHADTVGGTRRDFRTKIAAGNSSQNNPVKWIKSDVEHVKKNLYKKELEIPGEGWRAFYIQVVFTKDMFEQDWVLTSEIYIIPQTFPCPDCNGDGCHGSLV